MNGDIECTTPIVAIFDDSACKLHMDIPPLKSYNQVRKDSESDMDDTGESANPTNYSTDNFTENIKHEFVPYDIPPELPKMETLPSLLFEENSQSLSESTESLNELINITETNLTPLKNLDCVVKKEENSSIGFYQISESCTLLPGSSGLITVSTQGSQESQQVQTWNKSHLPKLDVPNVKVNDEELLSTSQTEILKLNSPTTDSVLVDQPINTEPVAGPSGITDPKAKIKLDKIEELSICDKSEIKNESQEISDIEVANMEMDTTEVVEQQKIPEIVTEQTTACEMEVCTDQEDIQMM